VFVFVLVLVVFCVFFFLFVFFGRDYHRLWSWICLAVAFRISFFRAFAAHAFSPWACGVCESAGFFMFCVLFFFLLFMCSLLF